MWICKKLVYPNMCPLKKEDSIYVKQMPWLF